MSTQTANQPAHVIRDGALKITIWENDGEKGTFFTATIAKTYEKGGELHDGQNLTGTDLLRVGEMTRQAYSKMGTLRRRKTREANHAPAKREQNLAEHYPG